MQKYLLVCASCLLGSCAREPRSAPPEPSHAEMENASREKRAEKEEVYVPKNLHECFTQLERLLSKKDIERMKSGSIDNTIAYHFSVGMWMRNNWGLWAESRLWRHLVSLGISRHPDDMSAFILRAFWIYLREGRMSEKEYVEKNSEYELLHLQSEYDLQLFREILEEQGFLAVEEEELEEQDLPTVDEAERVPPSQE